MTTTQFDDPLYLDAVYQALQDQLKTATFPVGYGIKTWERAYFTPDKVPVADQPAFYLIEGPLHVEQKELFGPAKWTFTALGALYIRANTTRASDVTVAVTNGNVLIWGLKNSLETTPPYEKQTLGGLVTHCWIEGQVSPEVENEQVLITVPIWMLAGPVG